MPRHSAFWDDLAADLEDPEFLREYIAESIRIATIDAIVNAINDAREELNLSKADLARAISVEPATVRRLFSAERRNPTLGTVAELAAAVGMEVALVPMRPRERSLVQDPLLSGHPEDAPALARRLHELRSSGRNLVPC